MEYENEPVEGLPETLPEGEHIIWQGAPDWRSFAIHVFHVRKIAVYFTLLVLWGAWPKAGGSELLLSLSWYMLMAVVCLGMLTLLARAYARATLYTITNKRLVMRFGVALPMMINIPWTKLNSGDLQLFADGTGNIALSPRAGCKISYSMVWPNVRPWHWNPVQPALRAIPDAQKVAGQLALIFGQRFNPSVTTDHASADNHSSTLAASG